MPSNRSLAQRLTDYGSQKSLGSRFRARRIVPLLRVIEDISLQQGYVNIIDVGGTAEYWGIAPPGFLQKHNVTITVVNLPGAGLPEDTDVLRFMHADGCKLTEFADDSFHIAHSNSVIEHVGGWEQMVQFAGEIRRVAKTYFVQTPNYWFPVEPHCMTPLFHWLPRSIRIRIVMKVSLGHWEKATDARHAAEIVDGSRLLKKAEFQSLFPDSEVLVERFALLAKSFVAIRA